MSEEEKEIQNTEAEEVSETAPSEGETIEASPTEATAEEKPYRYRWDYSLQKSYDDAQLKKTRRRGAWTFAIVMSVAFLVCLAMLVGVLLIADHDTPTAEPIPTEDVAEIVKPQTVLIAAELNGEVGYGTGFFIREDGYIATNYHVVENADRIDVILYSGETQTATLVGYSIPDDLAVLKISGRYYPTVTIGDSDLLRVGATAIAVGHPMGTSYAWTTTQGIISALDRTIVVSDEVAFYETEMIQMDTPVNTGNSGGPLCNDQGEVVGIVTRKVSGYDYIGLALPINGAMVILEEIIENGNADGITSPITRTRPLIGITGTTVTMGESYSLDQVQYVSEYDGVVIYEVSKNSPADGKIMSGDILVSFNDIKVTNMDTLTNILYECKLGQTVNFEVIRNGQSVKGTITFSTRQ